MLCVDDLHKVGFQGSAPNEETVNVFFFCQFFGVSSGDRSSVDDLYGLRNLRAHGFREPVSKFVVNFLRLLGSRGLSSSDGPNWLISQDDVVPGLDFVGDGLGLAVNDLFRFPGFAFFEFLADASDYL